MSSSAGDTNDPSAADAAGGKRKRVAPKQFDSHSAPASQPKKHKPRPAAAAPAPAPIPELKIKLIVKPLVAELTAEEESLLDLEQLRRAS